MSQLQSMKLVKLVKYRRKKNVMMKFFLFFNYSLQLTGIIFIVIHLNLFSSYYYEFERFLFFIHKICLKILCYYFY